MNIMITTMDYTGKLPRTQKQVSQQSWQRIVLLIILGYEAAGCLLGGCLLIAAPDGRLMDMPVSLMHGVFNNFLIPGIILFGLGILNLAAFVSVFRRTISDWMIASLALGGLTIWFIVEIAILQELHWLHFMWAFPVFLGWVAAIPFVIERHRTVTMVKALLICGILSSLWYVAINIFVPGMYQGYNMTSLTVSELSAIGAPTRVLWVLLAMPYPLLFAAFGWGIWQLAEGNRFLRSVGVLIIAYSVMNFYWPPMHQREVIAAGGATLTDTLHIVWAITTILFMMVIMAYGAAALGKRFRIYTIATWIVFMVFGILTGMESPGIQRNLPTPHIGTWERINIGAFMLWVIVFAIILLKSKKFQSTFLRVNNKRLPVL
jgi:hypothetical protein